jgi:hypothetical protein
VSDDKIQYLLTTATGEQVIELDPKWKVTFAAVNPGGNPQGMHGRDLHCVRVWEMPGNKLRAVFCDVRGIRDLSIPLARKIQKETGSAEWTKDSAGNFEQSSKREIESHYEADAPEELTF